MAQKTFQMTGRAKLVVHTLCTIYKLEKLQLTKNSSTRLPSTSRAGSRAGSKDCDGLSAGLSTSCYPSLCPSAAATTTTTPTPTTATATHVDRKDLIRLDDFTCPLHLMESTMKDKQSNLNLLFLGLVTCRTLLRRTGNSKGVIFFCPAMDTKCLQWLFTNPWQANT